MMITYAVASAAAMRKRRSARPGGYAASSVSAKADYLVAGEKAGSELANAEQLGVPVIDKKAFRNLLG